jgi:uncharacterized protein (DUF2141 family)
MNLLSFFILVLITIHNLFSNANNVEVIITNFRNNEGQVVIGVYKDQVSFEKEKSFLVKKFDKKEVTQNFLIVKFNLEPGIYGLTLLDDENNNAKMEYNFVGMPKEGFGFSNYYHTGFTRPKFESFKIEVKKDILNKSKIKIRYI